MKFAVAISALFASVVNAQSPCGAPGTISTIGSSTVFIVTNKTAPAYAAQCPGNTMETASGGSSNGFRGVCAANSDGTINATNARDIGNMSRDFTTKEAELLLTDDQQQFKCLLGDTSREIIQLPVAIDGVPLFVGKTSKIWTECLEGQGLTSKEAQFLFSNDTALEAAFPDATGHYWNEICDTKVPAKTPIVLVAPSKVYGTNQYFKEVILTGKSEDYRADVKFFDDNSQALEDAVVKNDYAIGFLGYAYFKANSDTMAGIKIDGVEPTDPNLIKGDYLPLGRRIYSNFWKGALDKSACFAHFHMSPAGQKIVSDVGYLDIPSEEFGFLKAPFTQCVTVAPTQPPAPACARFCFPWNRTCCSARRSRRGRCTCTPAM